MTPRSSRYEPPKTSAGQRRSGADRTLADLVPGDIEADILTEACRPGVGDPLMIHIRPAIYARMLAETRSAWSHDRCREGEHIPFVIDDDIPSTPGYEIRRAAPQGWTCST